MPGRDFLNLFERLRARQNEIKVHYADSCHANVRIWNISRFTDTKSASHHDNGAA